MKGFILALAAMSLFSLYSIFGKILLESVDPIIILIVNQALAGILIIGVMDLFRKIKRLTHASRSELRVIYMLSLMSSVAAPLLFLYGLSMTTATNSILIGKSEALAMSLFAVAFLREKITSQQVAGTAFMILGIAVISTRNFTSVAVNPGDALVLLSAIVYAGGNVLFKKYMSHIPAEVIVAMRNVFGAATLFAISLLIVNPMAAFHFAGVLTPTFVTALLCLVVLTTISGQFLWYKALEITSAARASVSILFSPVFGIFYAVTLLGEHLSESQILGGILIVAGMVVIEIHIRQIRSPIKRKFHLKLKHHRH